MKKCILLLILIGSTWCCSDSLAQQYVYSNRKITTLEEYRQLDTGGLFSSFVEFELDNCHYALYLYTDVDIVLKHMRPTIIAEFLKNNKENFKIYRDVINDGVLFYFLDSLIGAHGFNKERNVYLTYHLKNHFAVEDVNHNIIHFSGDHPKDMNGQDSLLLYMKQSLYDVVNKFRNSTEYEMDRSCYEEIFDYYYPNYVVLHYNALKGLDIMYFDELEYVDLCNTYFRTIRDLFSEMCKNYKLLNIFATVPVLKYSQGRN